MVVNQVQSTFLEKGTTCLYATKDSELDRLSFTAQASNHTALRTAMMFADPFSLHPTIRKNGWNSNRSRWNRSSCLGSCTPCFADCASTMAGPCFRNSVCHSPIG